MLYGLVVSDSWLVSLIAKRIYVAAALLTVLLRGFMLAVIFATAAARGTLQQAILLAFVLKALMLPGVLGAAVLWIGMLYFWFRHHPGEGMSKPLWAAELWLLGPVGALFYFLIVYLRSRAVLAVPKRQATA
jgi:hypothetical protein